jgi:trehalose-6-phosphatase
VLELRPAGGGGKAAAVSALVESGEGITAAAYAGDDRTDLDAFRRLRELREAGELQLAVCVGVTSVEGPPELAAESDVTVEGPAGWLAVLECLASAGKR